MAHYQLNEFRKAESRSVKKAKGTLNFHRLESMRFYSPLGGGIKKLFPPDHQINERVSVANE